MNNKKYSALYARTLVTGDAIVIAYSNNLALGIFKGLGKTGNVHYFSVNQYNLHRFRDKRIYISYINRNISRSIAKIDENEIEGNERVIFDEMKHLLRQNGKI